MAQEKIWIFGCGDLGTRLALKLNRDRYRVFGVRRNPLQALACKRRASGIQWRRGDVSKVADIQPLLVNGADVVVATLTPSGSTPSGYHRAYVDTATALTQALSGLECPPRLVIWVSSSRVYGQSSDLPINESTPPKPSGFRGEALLAAEKIVQQALPQSCVVRFSGIYGPGRDRLLAKVRSGYCASSQQAQFSNRIHVEDAVGFLAYLIEQQRTGMRLEPLYLGTDCEPAPMFQSQRWLAKLMGLTAAHLKEETITSARGSKKLSNQRMLNSGYCMRYPNYRSGYRALLGIGS